VPRRGEIWRVGLDPVVGSEIRKTRPVIVISSDALRTLPVKVVVPVTEWRDQLAELIWHVRLTPDTSNGLTKPSSADGMQVRSVAHERFVERLGRVDTGALEDVVAAVAAVIEAQ
jgi:mRNA interferase MazF